MVRNDDFYRQQCAPSGAKTRQHFKLKPMKMFKQSLVCLEKSMFHQVTRTETCLLRQGSDEKVCSGKSYVLIIFASWEMFLPTVSIQPRRGWPQKDKAIKWNANVVLGFMNDLNFGYFLSDGRHYIGAKNVRNNRKKHNYYFLQFFLNVFHQIYFHILQFRQKGFCKFFMFTK